MVSGFRLTFLTFLIGQGGEPEEKCYFVFDFKPWRRRLPPAFSKMEAPQLIDLMHPPETFFHVIQISCMNMPMS